MHSYLELDLHCACRPAHVKLRSDSYIIFIDNNICKILNNGSVQCLDKGGALHEGQAGFRLNRGCMDNV